MKAKPAENAILGGQNGSPEGEWISCRCGRHWWCLTSAKWYSLTTRGNVPVENAPLACMLAHPTEKKTEGLA